MDKKLLVHELEKAVERNSTREEFWEKLRTLTFAIFTFAEQVLILCRPTEPNYLFDDGCHYQFAGQSDRANSVEWIRGTIFCPALCP